MKKITSFFIGSLLLFSVFCHGQGLRGSVLASGSVNYTSQPSASQQGTQELETTYFSVQPMVGYFLHDRWALGALVTYSHSDADTPFAFYMYGGGNTPYYAIGKVKSTTWEVGAFTRYYFPVTQNFFLIGQLSAGYSSLDLEVDLPGNSIASSSSQNATYFASASPHLTYLPLPWLGLELGLGEVKYQQETETDDKNFTVNLNPASIKVGLSFYLGRSSVATGE